MFTPSLFPSFPPPVLFVLSLPPVVVVSVVVGGGLIDTNVLPIAHVSNLCVGGFNSLNNRGMNSFNVGDTTLYSGLGLGGGASDPRASSITCVVETVVRGSTFDEPKPRPLKTQCSSLSASSNVSPTRVNTGNQRSA